MHTTAELEILIKKASEGDFVSQQAIYKLLSSRLYGMALRYLKVKEDAEDVLQDSFVIIFQNLKSFKHEGSFEGWAKKILMRRMIKEFNKRKIEKQWEDVEEHAETLDAGIDISGRYDREVLLSSLHFLTDAKKLVFNMYVIEGYTHKEIGELLHISEGTSKSQLARAKEQLQKILIRSGMKNE